MKVAQFLDKSLTDEELDKLEDHIKFENFVSNITVNQDMGKFVGLMNLDVDFSFMRKGNLHIESRNFKGLTNYVIRLKELLVIGRSISLPN